MDDQYIAQSFPVRGNRRSKSLPKNLAKKYYRLKERKESIGDALPSSYESKEDDVFSQDK